MAESRTIDIRDQPGFRSIAIICLLVLYVPVLILMIFSLNSGSLVTHWEGVTLGWYGSALRDALECVQAHHAAAAGARHHVGRGTRLHRLLRRFHHHAACRRPRPDDTAPLHLEPDQASDDAGDQRHLHHPAFGVDPVRLRLVPDRAPTRKMTMSSNTTMGRQGEHKMSGKLMSTVSAAVLLSAAPALADGELHIYNWGDYTNPKLTEKLEKRYNRKVTRDAS